MASVRSMSVMVLVAIVAATGWAGSVVADTNLPIGGQGLVVNTDGEGVRIRERPEGSSDTLRTLGENWRLTVLAGPVSGENGPWYKVEHTGATGYVFSDYLTTANGAAGMLFVGEQAHVITDDGTSLRLRSAPNGTVLATMPSGSQVSVAGGPVIDEDQQRWYQVTFDGQDGWALGAYLRPGLLEQVVAQRDTTSRAGTRAAAEPSQPAAPAPPPASRGAAITATAMTYLGASYQWGGSTPAGFDCSGFTRYVILQATGVDIGRDTFAQANAGVPVAANDLQPGDLVFQQNTYRWGLSHVGIYIGGGKMINAQSEHSGVKVQAIWDGYWGPRFHSARRIS